MNSDFQEAIDQLCIVYLDGILNYSYSTLEHHLYIKWVLSKLRSNSLLAKPTKYQFGLTKLEYFEHIISSGIIKLDPKKTEAI